MVKYIGMIVCNIYPKFPEKDTKEYDNFLKAITSKEPLKEEETDVWRNGSAPA